MKEFDITEIMKIQAKQRIREGFKKWGIERTEEKIRYNYHLNSKMSDFMLECYREILRGE